MNNHVLMVGFRERSGDRCEFDQLGASADDADDLHGELLLDTLGYGPSAVPKTEFRPMIK
ncbi:MULTISPECIES: hypothetical protein [unclassified Streptomyces]|uniref:hypothetical protein n=1 Tax=unclassified Streptomyces TaxID=2593676 RepID=UPI0027D77CFE|nr:hypothetical protein [Streptomyces sp. V1I1]